MFVRMFKSPFGHGRHYADAAHQQEGGSPSPLSIPQPWALPMIGGKEGLISQGQAFGVATRHP